MGKNLYATDSLVSYTKNEISLIKKIIRTQALRKTQIEGKLLMGGGYFYKYDNDTIAYVCIMDGGPVGSFKNEYYFNISGKLIGCIEHIYHYKNIPVSEIMYIPSSSKKIRIKERTRTTFFYQDKVVYTSKYKEGIFPILPPEEIIIEVKELKSEIILYQQVYKNDK